MYVHMSSSLQVMLQIYNMQLAKYMIGLLHHLLNHGIEMWLSDSPYCNLEKFIIECFHVKVARVKIFSSSRAADENFLTMKLCCFTYETPVYSVQIIFSSVAIEVAMHNMYIT